LAERRSHPIIRIVYAIVLIVLALATGEFAMRYLDRPATVISGWRVTGAEGPINPLGWRGRPWQRHPNDFVVVMTGAGDVECLRCPSGETMDLILERALRQYNPNARVVTLGAGGYGQDQEYLALHDYFAQERADLVIAWTSIAEDVPANTFRTGQPRPGQTMLKPTFALRLKEIFGPTETIGTPFYHSKFATLMWPLFFNAEQRWNQELPPADPGAPTPPPGVEERTGEPLEEQRSAWSIWMTPRPARVKYGIDLTRTLLLRIRDLSVLHGARFMVLRTLSPASEHPNGPIALEHSGHWFRADPAARDAAIAEITQGFDPIELPRDDDPAPSPATERRIMARLAEALNQRNLLIPATSDRPRH
jgi:hypothetical protein